MTSKRQNTDPPTRQPGAPKPQGNATKIQQIKIVLLGDQGVGKSSIALRFVRGEFPENSEATIGAAFLTHTINISSHILKFDIWDTAGQERYRSLAPMYYRGAQAAVVVYDITHQNSFDKAMSWIKELQHQASSNVVIVLAGNKADLAAESRAVSSEDARSYAEGNNLIYGEVSAKTGLAVNDIFMAIARRLSVAISSGASFPQRPQGIRLTEHSHEIDYDDDGGGVEGGGKGCC